MSLFSELKRRNVIRTASAYAVVAWLLLQLASVLLPTFMAPPWVMQGITILLVVGFPVAIALAWIFNITPDGIVRDDDDGSATPHQSRYLIDASIIGVLLIAVTLFAYDEFVVEPREGISSVRPAIAVLPFGATSDDPETRMFADGLATELIARLSSWPSMVVIARAASFADGIEDDIFAAGQRLDARYFVTGTVQQSADDLRISVSVVDSIDGSVIWSRPFDRSADNIIALQDEISTAIVGQLQPALLERESERAMRSDPANVDAWEAAHKGWWLINTETEEGYLQALEWFDAAIERDPNWGWPYAARALSMYRANLNGYVSRSEEFVAEVFTLAEKAVQLDAGDAFAHHALGHAYGMANRSDDSIRAMERGIQLNPNDAMAQGCFGMALAAAARSEEAISAIEVAMSLSPDDPWMYWFTLVLARAHFAASDYSTSKQWAERSGQIEPNFPAFLHATSSEAHLGEVEQARERVIAWRQNRWMPPSLDMLEASFRANTEADYTTRLFNGLRMADFETAGVEESP